MNKVLLNTVDTNREVPSLYSDGGFAGVPDQADIFSGSINDATTTPLTLVNVTNACYISVLNETSDSVLQFSIDGGTTWLLAKRNANGDYVGIELSVAFTTLSIKNASGKAVAYTIHVLGA